MAALTEPLRRTFLGQARACAQLGSPFSGRVLERLAGPLAGVVAPLLTPWTQADVVQIVADATPLRLLGALHWLVLTGAEPELAALYPPQSTEASEALDRVLAEVLTRSRSEIERFMQSPPQTNEVRRTLALVGGFLTVARETGLPLRCLEIGASAGLNLSWDRFRYSFGAGAGWGDRVSPVSIEGDWRGPPPPVQAGARVAERAACDLSPVDAADPAQALRLQAYIWPDQLDRLARLRAAIDLAVEAKIRVERADAAAWLAERLSPRLGVATVLFHSVMWQYMPPETQSSIRARLELAAALASPEAPLAWLRLEPEALTAGDMEVRLTLWPGGEERVLARAHPHGAWVEWLAA